MDKLILQRIKDKLRLLPTTPGVYRMLDIDGNIIYIGKAVNLKRRVSSYFVATKKPEKVEQMVSHIYDFEYTITNSELEALNLESNLIHKVQPFYNILLKDGKAFPYIRINTTKDFPTIEITRKVLRDKALYFGPYFNKVDIKTLVTIIENTFRLRNCKHNITLNKSLPRPCLNYSMGLCLAPCVNKDIVPEYKEEVKKVINFLRGDLKEAKEILTAKMLNASKMELYEKAIEYRNDLQLIANLNAQNITELTHDLDLDVFGYASNGQTSVIDLLVVRGGKMVGSSNYTVIDGSLTQSDIMVNFITQYYLSQRAMPSQIIVDIEDASILAEWATANNGKKVIVTTAKIGVKKHLLDMANANAIEYLTKSVEKDKLYMVKTEGAMKKLQNVLGLRRLPRRIEGYDISNLQGTNTVSSMVVFENGVPNKKHYRKFKINIDQQNDFYSMYNTISRRFAEYNNGTDVSFAKLPDLILIDGGLGQLHKAYESMQSLGIDVDIVSLAKRDELIYTIHSSTPVHLAKSDYALRLLQQVRDESHRFAITFQKSLRKNTLSSELNKINGVGKTKVDALYNHFKSISAIRDATIEEISQVNGIGKSTAKIIYDYFHKI